VKKGQTPPLATTLRVNGYDLTDKNTDFKELRSKVGMVFQYPEHQLFAATVFEDVAFGPRNMGLSPEEVEERVLWALEKVGLDANDVREKSPFELSGGQQRRAAFAGVLAMKPRVLVLDEPVAGLDPQAREEFLQLISRLHEQGITIAMVSHSMEDLARMCDRILVLNKGEIFALGDNRHDSKDSTYYGTFDSKSILGIVELERKYDENKFAFYWNYVTLGKFFDTIINCF